MDKRSFIKKSALAAFTLAPALKWLDDIDVTYQNESLAQITSNEEYWSAIRAGYRLKPDYINLENGYYCFMPNATLERYIQHIRDVNLEGSRYMRTVQWENKDKSAHRLADMIGSGHDELVITRNTTESMDIIINGYAWQKGDEAVMAEQDYTSIVNQFELMAKRYGIVNKIVSVPTHPVSDQEIVDMYAKAITPKTKLLMVCHMVNITGHILPIRKICDMAHAKGVDVMVDGAHAIAHLDFNIKDLDCDYYASSLHKWLSVPLGAGLLYVKREKISHLYPMMAPWVEDQNDIKKLNHIGTHPVHTDLSIIDAIDFYQAMGAAKKEARLRYLQRYWTDKVRDVKGIVLNTPKDAHRSCAIANIGLANMPAKDMAKVLLEKHKIWTVGIEGQGINGCRITPNVYTTTAELDTFVDALMKMK
ncbi:MAG: aminotransferase class V-fold PLP-dependent enzyme [Saprospiraceae bacterium]